MLGLVAGEVRGNLVESLLEVSTVAPVSIYGYYFLIWNRAVLEARLS